MNGDPSIEKNSNQRKGQQKVRKKKLKKKIKYKTRFANNEFTRKNIYKIVKGKKIQNKV